MINRSTNWQDAAHPERNVWVSANAGTGKTFTLIRRVARLLLNDAAPEKILCLTYTRTAAAEMQSRLFEQLGKWAMLSDSDLRREIESIGQESPDRLDLRTARRLFAKALETPGGLKIQTIHAFCERLLSRFPLEAGVPPAFRVLDEQSAHELIADAQARVLEEASLGDATLSGAVAVLATHAGDQTVREVLKSALGADRSKLESFVKDKTGETIAETIATAHDTLPQATYESVAQDFCDGLRREQNQLRAAIAWLSTANKSEQNVARQLSILVDNGFDGEFFDSFSRGMLTAENEINKRLMTKKLASHPEISSYIEDLASRVHAAKLRCLAARAAALTHAAVTLADACLRIYREEKRARNVLDYNDLIAETLRLFERSSAAAWVLYKLDEGLDHILIDEAQDTSDEQWSIVKALAGEFFAGVGARDEKVRTIFAVGDEKQSIFGFQGADPASFGRNRLHFMQLAGQAGGVLQEVDLVVSRRSTREILDFVDTVISSPRAREGLTSDDRITPHKPHREKAKGCVEFWPLTEAPEPAEPDYWMLPLDVERPGSAVRLLANEIAHRIRRWTDGKTRLAGHDRPIRPGDIMILTPRRDPFASVVIKRLRELGVPVAGADRIRLIEQIGVMDLIALGRFALLPEDDLNLAALLRSPLIDMSEDDLRELAHPRKGTLWAELASRRGEKPSYEAARDYLARALARADFVPPHEFFAEVLGAGGGRRKLLARLGFDAADALDEFLSLALVYEGLNTPSLEGFLHWVERGEAEIKRDMESGRDEVRVMTVHASKGLEADIVILPDTARSPKKGLGGPKLLFDENGDVFYTLNDAEAPPRTAAAKEAAHRRQLQEYRRLLYVALTRAKDRLCICGFAGKGAQNDESWYSLMRDAVAESGIEAVRDGKALRIFGEADTEPVAVAERLETAAALPDWARNPPPAERERPRLIRPFDAAGVDDIVSSPLSDGNAGRFRRGLLIHSLLAGLPDVDAEKRETVARQFLASHGLEDDEIAALTKQTLAVLNDPVFAPVFSSSSRAEVALVADLPEIAAGARVSGRIDRLAANGDQVLIVDFKTNRPPPVREEDVPALYLSQMALYRAALQRIYPGKRVAAALVWTEGPRLMQLSDATLNAEIGRIRARLDSQASHS